MSGVHQWQSQKKLMSLDYQDTEISGPCGAIVDCGLNTSLAGILEKRTV